MRSRTPGRARTTPLTPLRREGRVAPVEPVVNNSCAFYNAHEAAGATSIRSSLRPCLLRDNVDAKLGRKTRRGHEHACFKDCRHCEERSDEAIQCRRVTQD